MNAEFELNLLKRKNSHLQEVMSLNMTQALTLLLHKRYISSKPYKFNYLRDPSNNQY